MDVQYRSIFIDSVKKNHRKTGNEAVRNTAYTIGFLCTLIILNKSLSCCSSISV